MSLGGNNIGFWGREGLIGGIVSPISMFLLNLSEENHILEYSSDFKIFKCGSDVVKTSTAICVSVMINFAF